MITTLPRSIAALHLLLHMPCHKHRLNALESTDSTHACPLFSATCPICVACFVACFFMLCSCSMFVLVLVLVFGILFNHSQFIRTLCFCHFLPVHSRITICPTNSDVTCTAIGCTSSYTIRHLQHLPSCRCFLCPPSREEQSCPSTRICFAWIARRSGQEHPHTAHFPPFRGHHERSLGLPRGPDACSGRVCSQATSVA
jgi:hypothetical protein